MVTNWEFEKRNEKKHGELWRRDQFFGKENFFGKTQKQKTASVGLEPTIFSLEGRRSIHFATGLCTFGS